MPINKEHADLAIQARDAVTEYEQKNFLFLKGQIPVEEVMKAKSSKERIEKHFRSIMKKEHRRIERELKTKYGTHERGVV